MQNEIPDDACQFVLKVGVEMMEFAEANIVFYNGCEGDLGHDRSRSKARGWSVAADVGNEAKAAQGTAKNGPPLP
jgi:hypothetical protein